MGWEEMSQLLLAQGSWRVLGIEARWGFGLGQRKSSPHPLGSFFFLVGKRLSSSQTLTLLWLGSYLNSPRSAGPQRA